MDEKTTRAGMSRREFARRAAMASAVASLGPVNALHAGPSARAQQTPQPPNMPKLSPEGQSEAEARLQTILAQYGTRFSEDQKTDLRRLCLLAQPPLDRLRAYAVENGDGPALYLKPLVEREKNPRPSRLRPRREHLTGRNRVACAQPPSAAKPPTPVAQAPGPSVVQGSLTSSSKAALRKAWMPSEEIHYLPASELAKRIQSKKLSPVELTQTYLDRSEKIGPRLNAYARLTPEIALGAGPSRRKRNSARPLPRAAARNSLRRQRFTRRQRYAHDLGRKTVRQPGFRLRRHGDRAS